LLSLAACAARRSSSVRSAFASDRSWSILRDSAESDLRAPAAGAEPKEPKPPPDFLAAPLSLLPRPKLPDFEDEDEERCDENPLLKDGELDGLACAGADASDSVRHSANTTCAYFEMVFSMVRWAGES
jgi:hypothetical protein